VLGVCGDPRPAESWREKMRSSAWERPGWKGGGEGWESIVRVLD
jgi:hypothetical protein